MKLNLHFLKRPFLKVFVLMLAVASGIFLFQANNPGGSDDSNRLIDQPTTEFYTHFPHQITNQKDVITDASGYDNFDIGADGSEMNATVNPNNPLQIFFGVNGPPGPLNSRYTLDGFNWNQVTLGYPSGTCCDPWTAYDSVGNLFFSVINTSTGNWTARSTNFGVSFGSFVLASPGTDRNSIAADFTGGPYTNNVYATAWAQSGQSIASFSRSTDHGQTWSTIISNTVNTTPGNMICIGPNGNIQGGCVYWVTISGSNPAPSTFNFFRSTDGGATMIQMSSNAISPGYVGTINSASRLVINNARTRPYPMIACDNSYGTYRGRLYCVYASNNPAGNGNKPDIKCQYSTDGGTTWSAAVIVNDDANSQNADQWYPAVWCEKTTGKLYVKWYDDRNNPSAYGVDVYASYSTNGGQSFVTNQRLTNATWTYPCPACGANQNCYRGDYDAISANPNVALAIWSDMRNCQYQNMASYFPDFAMMIRPLTFNLNNQNDSGFVFVSVPSVKLYTDKAKFTYVLTPTPSAGTITINFLNKSSNVNQDSLTAYPDSIRMRIKTSGGVTSGAYTVTIQGAGSNGTPIHKRVFNLGINPVGLVQNNNQVPENFSLYQNYPNPFNPTTTIRFDIAKTGLVKLVVYDITGRVVGNLINNVYDPGKYSFQFSADKFASGIYFYKLDAPGYTDIKKMILIK